jgi:hypothetical protein
MVAQAEEPVVGQLVPLGEHFPDAGQPVKRQDPHLLPHTGTPARAAWTNGVICHTGSSSVVLAITRCEM